MATSEDIAKQLLSDIKAVRGARKIEVWGQLRVIGVRILAVRRTLTRIELIDVSAEFSAAFKEVGKPDWASGICRTLDRRMMAMDTETNRPPPLTGLPYAEFTPHPVVTEPRRDADQDRSCIARA